MSERGELKKAFKLFTVITKQLLTGNMRKVSIREADCTNDV